MNKQQRAAWSRCILDAGLYGLIFVTLLQVPLALLAGIDGYRMYMTAAELIHAVSFLLLVDAAAIVALALIPSLIAGLIINMRVFSAEMTIRVLVPCNMALFLFFALFWAVHSMMSWAGTVFAL